MGKLTRLLLLCWMIVAGCGDDTPAAQQKKELLRPDEARRRRVEERERARTFDVQGELLPSGELIGGLEMPRGLKLYRELPREYYLEAPRISVEQLERFFAPRLEPTEVLRAASALTFGGARIKANPTAPLVTLRLSRVDTHGAASELMLRLAPPPRVFPSQEEAERQLAERRKYPQ